MPFARPRLSFILALALFAAFSAAAAQPLLVDGSFEGSEPGKPPLGFELYNKAAARVEVVEGKAFDGKRSLFISNATPLTPQVYANLYCKLKLSPGVRYRLSCQACGEQASRVSFRLGKDWRQKLFLTDLSPDWKERSLEFQAEPGLFDKDGRYHFAILSEDLAKGVWLDKLSIEPLIDVEALPKERFQEARVFLAPKLTGGSPLPKSLPEFAPLLRLPADASRFTGGDAKGVKPFSALLSWAWDEDGLIFMAEVAKGSPVYGVDGSEMWKYDSVQLALERRAGGAAAVKPCDLEIGLSPADGYVNTWFWQQNRALREDEAEVFGSKGPDGYFLCVKLKRAFFGEDVLAKPCLSFNALVNDYENGRRNVAFLERGIHDGKTNEFNTLLLLDKGEPGLVAVVDDNHAQDFVKGKAYVFNLTSSSPLEALLKSQLGGEAALRLAELPTSSKGELLEASFKIPLDALKAGPYEAVFSAGKAAPFAMSGVKSDWGKDLEAKARELESSLAGRSAALKPFAASPYLSLPEALLRNYIPRLRGFVKQAEAAELPEERQYCLRRAETLGQELDAVLAKLDETAASAQRGELPLAFRYVSSAGALRPDGFQSAELAAPDGTRSRRMAFFGGYGHFKQAVAGLPELRQYFSDALQIETGPFNTFPKPDLSKPSLESFRSHMENGMKEAWLNDAKIVPLLSPHYMPEWAFKRSPEMRINGRRGYEVWHPTAREVVERHLRAVVPPMRDSEWKDAIHSLCLSNEAVYSNCRWDNPFSVALFRKALEAKRPGGVAALNKLSGASFASFEEALAAGDSNPVMRYEFHSWKAKSFAAWHKWMADVIHELWPEVQTSAKIMVNHNNRMAYMEEGVDLEEFANALELNGNDNFDLYGTNDWAVMLAVHDKQRSMRRSPVVNTENHIIRDGESQLIPWRHTYTAVFEQYMQGVQLLATWVWNPDCGFAGRASSNAGNIGGRPANVMGCSLATLDALRLSSEIAAFADAAPEVAVLYSQSSYVHSGRENPSDGELLLHGMASSLGFKTGFVSERQLAAGELGGLKAILAPLTRNLPEGAAASLRSFSERGGLVLTLGDCFKADEYDRPFTMAVKAGSLGSSLRSPEVFERLKTALAPLAPLKADFEGGHSSLVFQAVPYGKGLLVNLVSRKSAPCEVKLSLPAKASAIELLSAKPSNGSFTLAPFEPKLLKISFEQ